MLCRLGSAVLFRSSCPSPNHGYPFWFLALTFRSSRPAFCGRLTSPVSLRKTRFIKPHVLFTGVYLLKRLSAGFLPCAGLRLLALRQFQALLASSARPACASSFCFRSILGLAALWLTGQSSRPAFGGRLTLFVSTTENQFI